MAGKSGIICVKTRCHPSQASNTCYSPHLGCFRMLPPVYRRFVPVLVASGLLLNGFVAWKDSDLILKGYPDFTGLYAAGQIVRGGEGNRLYDLDLEYQLQLEFASHVSIRHGALPYIHPPFEALLFAPLSLLPYFAAYLVWNGMSLAILAWAMVMLRPHLPLVQSSHLGLWVLISIAYFPVFICLLQGQDMQLILLAVAGAYLCLQAGNDFRAGCWLGLGLFRPQLILPLFFIILLGQAGGRRRWLPSTVRLSAGLGLMAALECAASVAVSGWSGFRYYPKYVWMLERNGGYGAIEPADMPNVRGLVAALLPDSSRTALMAIAAVSIVILVLAGLAFGRARRSGSLGLGFSLALVATVLTSYHAFMYDLALLLWASILVLNYVRDRAGNPDAVSLWLMLGPVGLLFSTPLLMLLWLRMGRLNILAAILALWLYGIAKEVSGSGMAALKSEWASA